MTKAPEKTAGRRPERPQNPEASMEEVAKRVRNGMLLILAIGVALPALDTFQEWQLNEKYRAKGDFYDKSTKNYVAPKLKDSTTPDEPLVDIGYETNFSDSRFGHKCMIKESHAKRVKAIMECFKGQFGRYPALSFCTRSNRTQKEIDARHKALEAEDGESRPSNKDDESPHVVRGFVLDIGTGPNEAEDYDLISKCAEEQGYSGGYCGTPDDPFHQAPGKTCSKATYAWNKGKWKARLLKHKWKDKTKSLFQ